MSAHFRILVTTGFARSLRRLTHKRPEIVEVYETALGALQADPTNLTRTRDVKKLTGVAAGDGQWRIRVREYRLRYDIEGENRRPTIHQRSEGCVPVTLSQWLPCTGSLVPASLKLLDAKSVSRFARD